MQQGFQSGTPLTISMDMSSSNLKWWMSSSNQVPSKWICETRHNSIKKGGGPIATNKIRLCLNMCARYPSKDGTCDHSSHEMMINLYMPPHMSQRSGKTRECSSCKGSPHHQELTHVPRISKQSRASKYKGLQTSQKHAELVIERARST